MTKPRNLFPLLPYTMSEPTPLESFAWRSGFYLTDVLNASKDEFHKLSKEIQDNDHVHHAALYQEWKARKKLPVAEATNTLQTLAEEADASIQDILALSADDFQYLSRSVFQTNICEHTKLFKERKSVLQDARISAAKTTGMSVSEEVPASDDQDSDVQEDLDEIETIKSDDEATEPEQVRAMFDSDEDTLSKTSDMTILEIVDNEVEATAKSDNKAAEPEQVRAQFDLHEERLSGSSDMAIPEVIISSHPDTVSSFPNNHRLPHATANGISHAERVTSRPESVVSACKGTQGKQKRSVPETARSGESAGPAVARIKVKCGHAPTYSAPAVNAVKMEGAQFFEPGSVEEKILRGLAELDALNIKDAPRNFVALFAGYSNVTSNAFSKALTKLHKTGCVSYAKKKAVRLTKLGKSLETQVVPPKSNAEMHARLKHILQKQKKKAGKIDAIFDTLADGQVHQAIDVAAAAGYTNLTSEGYAKPVSKMTSLGLVERPATGMLRLADIAFPFGRGSP